MSLLHKNTKSRKIQKKNSFAPYGFYYLHFFTEKSINTEIILFLLKKTFRHYFFLLFFLITTPTVDKTAHTATAAAILAPVAVTFFRVFSFLFII